MSTLTRRDLAGALLALGAVATPAVAAPQRGLLDLSAAKPDKGADWPEWPIAVVMLEITLLYGKAGFPPRGTADEWCPEEVQRELVHGVNHLLFLAHEIGRDMRGEVEQETGLPATGAATLAHARTLLDWLNEEHAPTAIEGPRGWSRLKLAGDANPRWFGGYNLLLIGPRDCRTEAEEVRATVELYAGAHMFSPDVLGPQPRFGLCPDAERLQAHYAEMERDVVRLVIPAFADAFIAGG